MRHINTKQVKAILMWHIVQGSLKYVLVLMWHIVQGSLKDVLVLMWYIVQGSLRSNINVVHCTGKYKNMFLY